MLKRLQIRRNPSARRRDSQAVVLPHSVLSHDEEQSTGVGQVVVVHRRMRWIIVGKCDKIVDVDKERRDPSSLRLKELKKARG